MSLSTSELRRAWAPACAPKGPVFLAAYRALDGCLRAWRYAPRKKDTGAYACRAITGGTGYSLHAYGPADKFTFWNGLTIHTSLAVDINWTTNPYGPRLVTDMPIGMIEQIEAIRTNSGAVVWRWGGRYKSNKDAMHFEIVCTPADLRTGIRGTAQPPKPLPKPPEPEDTFMPALTDTEQRELLEKVRATDLRVTQLQQEIVAVVDEHGKSRMDRIVDILVALDPRKKG